MVESSHHSEKTKKNLMSRLNRIEGQIRGIKGLLKMMFIVMMSLHNYLLLNRH